MSLPNVQMYFLLVLLEEIFVTQHKSIKLTMPYF